MGVERSWSVCGADVWLTVGPVRRFAAARPTKPGQLAVPARALQTELPAFAAPGANPGTAKGAAGLRGTGSYSRHRKGRCRPSRHRELLPAPKRKLPAFAAPGATPGTGKEVADLCDTGSYSRHREGRVASLRRTGKRRSMGAVAARLPLGETVCPSAKARPDAQPEARATNIRSTLTEASSGRPPVDRVDRVSKQGRRHTMAQVSGSQPEKKKCPT